MLKGCLIGPVVGVAVGLVIVFAFVFVLNPHRGPMLLLDGVLAQCDQTHVRGNLFFCGVVGFVAGCAVDRHTRKPDTPEEIENKPQEQDDTVWPPPPNIPMT